jgi:hypothetical protein
MLKWSLGCKMWDEHLTAEGEGSRIWMKMKLNCNQGLRKPWATHQKALEQILPRTAVLLYA